MKEKTYRIGQLAKALDVSTDTLRYYESNGLITCVMRSESGYRIYDEASLKQLRFILRSKAVGFSLNDIRELLKMNTDKRHYSCEEVRSLTLKKRDMINAKLLELEKFERSLSMLADACCGGSEKAEYCSILTALEEVDGTCK